MIRKVLAAVLVLAASSVALGSPNTPGDIHSGPRAAGQADRDQVKPQTQSAPTPVSAVLEQMSPAERENACISVEFSSSDEELIALGRDVERSWNAGQYDAALEQLRDLEGRVGAGHVAIGNSWRRPVSTMETQLWDDDVRIGNRDSINALAFDIHRASGNLFAALLYQEGSTYYWSVNLSTNGGSSWSETFTWYAGYELKTVNASVLGRDCYVVYGAGSSSYDLRLRRFFATNGLVDSLQGGVAYTTIATFSGGDSIKEVAMTSNQDFLDNRLYVLPLTYAGNLKYFWGDTSAVAWDTTPPIGITSAVTGVDACTNEGYDSTFIWVSYLGADDSLHITGRRGSGWRNFLTTQATDDNTSIGAWYDTVFCTYQYPGPVVNHVRYQVHYTGGNPGTPWLYWNIGDDTTTLSQASDVALRKGGGSGVIYRYYTPTREYRYTWRQYTGTWSTPVSLADHEPHWTHPAIEYLGSDVYGVVYLSWLSPVRAAYYDRSDWPTGLAEQRRLVMDENILNVTPNPLSGAGRLNYTLNRPANLRLQVYDRAGRVVRTLFDGHGPEGRQSLSFDAADMVPGVYFIRADAGGRALTVPITVVK